VSHADACLVVRAADRGVLRGIVPLGLRNSNLEISHARSLDLQMQHVVFVAEASSAGSDRPTVRTVCASTRDRNLDGGAVNEMLPAGTACAKFHQELLNHLVDPCKSRHR
jgi:hypothetical protein